MHICMFITIDWQFRVPHACRKIARYIARYSQLAICLMSIPLLILIANDNFDVLQKMLDFSG